MLSTAVLPHGSRSVLQLCSAVLAHEKKFPSSLGKCSASQALQGAASVIGASQPMVALLDRWMSCLLMGMLRTPANSLETKAQARCHAHLCAVCRVVGSS